MVDFSIQITKAGNREKVVNWDIISNPKMKALVVEAGLKAILNSKNSKFASGTKLKELPEDKREEALTAAFDQAESNLQALIDGSWAGARKGKAKTDKQDRLVAAEALRIARELVRDAIRKDKTAKISHYKPREITEIAKEVLGGHPELLTQAREALKQRAETPMDETIFAKLRPDPELVAKNEAKAAQAKAERDANRAAKGPTSAAGIAGRVTPRQRPALQS